MSTPSRALAAFFMVVALGGCRDPIELRLGDGEGEVLVSESGPLLALSRAGEPLLRFDRDAFQLGICNQLDPMIAYDPFRVALGESTPSLLRFLRADEARVIDSSPTSATVELSYPEGRSARLTISRDEAGRFTALFAPVDEGDDRVAFMRIRPRAGESEAFYGLGSVEDHVDLRGTLRPMQIEVEEGNEAFSTETNVPVPFLIGTRGWGLFVESERMGAFDLARQDPAQLEITYATAGARGEDLRLHLFAAEQAIDVTRHYYAVTGPPLLPARWALGPLFWRDENKDQAQVLDDLVQLRTLDLATSGMWIDRPFATAVNSFDFDATQFPDPGGMIKAIHDAGLRLALWNVPYLEPATGALRAEADQKGYFPPEPTIQFNNWSKPVDLTNPGAYAFWQGLVRRYTDLGVEGFKLDYAQDVVTTIPPDVRIPWRFFDGTDERIMHSRYQVLYHQVYAETLPREAGGLLLARTGRFGDQKHVSVIWPGDLDATLTKHNEPFVDRDGKTIVGVGGLPASLVVGLSLGPSGFPFYGSDTGGYRHSPPNRETFIRWFEQTALSTVMQVGDSSSQAPWEFTATNGRDQAALDLYREYARLHLRLFPYEWTLAQKLAVDGRPIMRPLGLAFPKLGAHPDDEYLFGDALLVAPVVTAGVTSREVILPPGKWIDWWDGTVYDGGDAGGVKITVAAPLEKLPLFMAHGAIVPMLRPTIDTMSPVADAAAIDSFATTPGVLWARVALVAGDSGSVTVYDGTQLSIVRTGNGLDLSLTDGTEFKLGALVEMMGVAPPGTLTFAGVPVLASATLADLEAAPQGWLHLAERGGVLYVKLPPQGGAQVR